MSQNSEQAKTKKTSLGVLPSILVVLALVILYIAERIVGEGSGRSTVAGLGSACFMAAFLFRLQNFAAAKGDAKRVEKRLLWATLGVLAGLLLYVLSSDTGLDMLGLRGSARDRVSGVLAALWPAVVAVALSALLFMETAYRRMPLAQAVELRRVQLASHAGLGLALAAVFLFAANYVVTKRDIKKDLSYFKTTRPSETSKKLVAKLGEDVRILAFYRETDDVLPQVQPYFAELAKHSKKIKFEVLDHALVPKLAREHRVQGNGHVLLLKGKDAGKRTQSERFEVGSDLEKARPNLKKLDATFQEKFTKLAQPPRSIQLTVGHGERNGKNREGYGPGQTTEGLKAILKQFNIKTSDLGLAQGLASNVPKQAGAVAVIGPREEFLPEEAQSMLRYVQQGGRLLLMLDPDVPVGLEPLLEGMGMKMSPGVVTNSRHHIPRFNNASDRQFITADNFTSHPSVTTAGRFSGQMSSVLLGSGALEPIKSNVPTTAKTVFPLSAPGGSFLDTNGNYEKDEGEVSGRLNLMAAVTFPGKNKREGRAVVLADGDFITDLLMRSKGNVYPFVDTIRWLIGEEDLSGDLSSEEDVPIEHSRDEDKWWFYLTTFAVPIPVVLAGLWMSRRRRRKGEARKS